MRLEAVELLREKQKGAGAGGAMYQGDVRGLLPRMLEAHRGSVQLIYLDPPFCTGKEFYMRVRVGEKEWRGGLGSLKVKAYEDGMNEEEYLAFMRGVLEGAHELLSEEGSLFLHTDYRMSAKLRLLLDDIFGASNMLNEIIWTYQTGGRAQRFFSRKHDTIFFYRKTRKYYFCPEAVAVLRPDARRNHMKRHIDADGRVYRSIRSGNKVYTYYDDEPVFPSDVWDDVSHMQQKDPQRTGYDTQKPIKLLERIVLCASREGDLVADLFAGSGTTLVAASENGRRFLGADLSANALEVTRRRLLGASAEYVSPVSVGAPQVSLEVRPAIADYEFTLTGYQMESGVAARSFSGMEALCGWSVGYIREGVFHAMAHADRALRGGKLDTQLKLPVLSGVPCVRLSDVLGRHFFYSITLDGTEGLQ